MRLARKWLYECAFEHPACPSPSPTPLLKRVLGVGAGGAGFILKLVETQGQHAQYAALSHCWGRARTFQTEQSTSKAREESIGWHALPKTFQDAVTTTRNLGLHYIWIDSLCTYSDRSRMKHCRNLRVEPPFCEGFDLQSGTPIALLRGP